MPDSLPSVLARACPPDGRFRVTAVDGLTLFGTAVPGDPLTGPTRPAADGPALVVVAAGRLRSRTLRFEPLTYAVVPVDLPFGHLHVEAHPFLSLRLRLDVPVLAELRDRMGAGPAAAGTPWNLPASPLTDELADALRRLVALLDDDQDRALLAPAVEREILYRLLRGPQRPVLDQVISVDSQLAHVMRAIEHIRGNYARPIRAGTLAGLARMSPSAFYQHFRTITTMSPGAYQRSLRLHEARRLLLDGRADATSAALAVGYTSASQFGREYKRLFGAPPMADATRLRNAGGSGKTAGEQL